MLPANMISQHVGIKRQSENLQTIQHGLLFSYLVANSALESHHQSVTV